MSDLISLLPAFLFLAVLLVLSFFFSGSETALFSLNRTQLRLMGSGNLGERFATKLIDSPQNLLSMLLVSNLFVNVMISSIISTITVKLAGEEFLVFAVPIATCILMVFGELTPKAIAVSYAHVWSTWASVPLYIITKTFGWLWTLLNYTSGGILFILGLKNDAGHERVTSEELNTMFAQGEAAGVANSHEHEIIRNIMEMEEVNANDIMIARTDIEAIDDSMTIHDAFMAAIKSKRSRMPVYKENLDGIWGYISSVDWAIWSRSKHVNKTLSEYRDLLNSNTARKLPVYSVIVVPEATKMQKLIAYTKEGNSKLVILVDEYGGTAGMLTMNDILQEIIGNIGVKSVKDNNAFRFHQGTLLVDGKMHLRFLERDLDMEFMEENESDTVGGYVMELMGKVPRLLDVVEDENYKYKVTKMVGRRIAAIQISRIDGEDFNMEEPAC